MKNIIKIITLSLVITPELAISEVKSDQMILNYSQQAVSLTSLELIKNNEKLLMKSLIKADRIYELENKIIRQITLEKPKTVRRVLSLRKQLSSTGKHYSKQVNNYRFATKQIKKLKLASTAFSTATKVGKTIEIYQDIQKMSANIDKGSTQILENLMITLKIAEELPTGNLLIFLPVKPSDYGRAIIDINVAMKQRNDSFARGVSTDLDILTELKVGKLKFETWITRKFSDHKNEYMNQNPRLLYEKLRKEYMSQIYAPLYSEVYKSGNLIEKTKKEVWRKSSIELYDSYQAWNESVFKQLGELSDEIWQNDRGFAFLKDLYEYENLKLDLKKDTMNLVKNEKAIQQKARDVYDNLTKEITTLEELKNKNYPDNIKQGNANMLTTNSAKTQGQTSHFGASDYFMTNINQTDNTQYENHEYRPRETAQENPYLEKGSVIIEAPADIVLAWGARPNDLDSHLTGPVNDTGSERFHTYFGNQGSLDSQPNVLLYHDDTDHYAGGNNLPEQTRINVTQPGKYNFYVHDYTNSDRANSTAMSNSGAVVSVHTAGNRNLPEGNNLGAKVAEYNIPTNKVGTVWHTFELDTVRNAIKPINEFSNVVDPNKVPFNK